VERDARDVWQKAGAAVKGFYFDEHMRRAVAKALIERGYHVVMAVDVGMEHKDDDTEQLPYAAEHDLVLVTFDRPFAGRTMSRSDHPGLICLSEAVRPQTGKILEILVEFAELYDPEHDSSQVHWLP
jgi:predicted nuclease of predicted toxin-antitoxin system